MYAKPNLGMSLERCVALIKIDWRGPRPPLGSCLVETSQDNWVEKEEVCQCRAAVARVATIPILRTGTKIN